MAEKKAEKAKKVVAPAPKAVLKTTPKRAASMLSVDQLEKEIRAEAQKVYENRRAKGLAGDELSDWLEAEIIIKKKHRL